MRIMIVSDTHRKDSNYFLALKKSWPIDMVFHCGDVEGSENMIQEQTPCPVEFVAGNNDFFCNLPREKELDVAGYKIWLTHGHTYFVSMENATIKQEAVAREMDIVFYGHTHKPVIDISKNITAVNPGSLAYPRQEGRRPSYVIMEIDREGSAHFTLCYL